MIKPIKSGLDYIRDAEWKIIKRTKKGALNIAKKQARREHPKGYWSGVVMDCGAYYRITIAGR